MSNSIAKFKNLHTYTNRSGSYDVQRLALWLNEGYGVCQWVKTETFAHYTSLCTWCEGDDLKTNLQVFLTSPIEQERVFQANLEIPIIILKENENLELIDGMHRVFKAVFTKQAFLPSYFISQSVLNKFRLFSCVK